MFIDSIGSMVRCPCYEEYRGQISGIMYSGLDNEIHIYPRESADGWDNDHPCTLSILVKGKEAVMNYFSEGNEEMFASTGDLDREEDFSWYIGANYYSAPGYQIVSLDKALECALQFFHSQEKPSCIAWEEL